MKKVQIVRSRKLVGERHANRGLFDCSAPLCRTHTPFLVPPAAVMDASEINTETWLVAQEKLSEPTEKKKTLRLEVKS